MAVIEVRGLTKRYGQITAVEDLEFDVEKGEVVGLLGPNGAGKTTTMRILTCFMPATDGTASVAGFDVFTDSDEVRKRIGYMPENVPLYTDMRVDEYLRFRGRIKGMSRSERRTRIPEVAERCWVSDVQNRIVGQLSKGYRQRVALADTLLHGPEVLILDEPTVGLDPNQVRQTRELIRELGKDHTVILSTHILPEVEAVCSRVLIINLGRLVPQETIDRYLKRSALRVTFKGDAKKIQEVTRMVEDVTRVILLKSQDESQIEIEHEQGKDVREQVSKAICEADGVILEMRPAALSLEERPALAVKGDVSAWRSNSIFHINQAKTGRTVLFGRWRCWWNGRVADVKYDPDAAN